MNSKMETTLRHQIEVTKLAVSTWHTAEEQGVTEGVLNPERRRAAANYNLGALRGMYLMAVQVIPERDIPADIRKAHQEYFELWDTELRRREVT